MDDKDFALRLSKLREKRGVSARDMSLSIGQNPGYINSIETGKSKPSLDVFFFICEYLEITPGAFFDSESSNPRKLDALIADLKKLSERQLDTVSALVKELISK